MYKSLLITHSHGKQYNVAASYFKKRFGLNSIKSQWVILEEFNNKKSLFDKLKFYYKRNLILVLILNILSRFFFLKSKVIYSHKQKFIDYELQKFYNNDLPSYSLGKSINSFQALEKFIDKFKPDVVYVIGAPLIPSYIIKLAPKWINLHIGKLPNYRGLKCIEWSILKNDKDGLVATIHELTPPLDAGPIIEEVDIKIDLSDQDLVTIYTNLYIAGIKRIFSKDIFSKLQKKEFIEKNTESYLYYSVNFNNYFKYLLLKKINLYNQDAIK